MENQPFTIRFTHFRHATSMLEIGGTKIMIDPMLAGKETLPPVILTANKLKNPLVDLPIAFAPHLNKVDYHLITHFHFDHFDQEAIGIIDKKATIVVSSTGHKKLSKKGFTNVILVKDELEINGINLKTFKAIHGKGLLRPLLVKGSSYLMASGETNIFMTGDNIWNKNLKSILLNTRPHYIIANGGAARFRFGKPITLTIQDIQEISQLLPETRIIVVHLDALNHCSESRNYCRKQVAANPCIIIPEDGETIELIK
jgi:L-ascorbate metabolism protein UlaG (beta-lactamase superfamily)